MTVQVVHSLMSVDADSGMRSIALAQADGMLLALDWVVGEAHHVWGSAVMVAPGIALTARHVIDEMQNRGFLGEIGGYLLALGFHRDGRMSIWNLDSLTTVTEGDLSILTLVRATDFSAEEFEQKILVRAAIIAARQPAVGEKLSFIGFVASDHTFERLAPESGAAIDMLGSVGTVSDLYPNGRGHNHPNPQIGAVGRTVGGMSGGGVFDGDGRLVGVITSGIGEDYSFISLSWPTLFTPVTVKWPPSLYVEETTLHALAGKNLAHIVGIENVSAAVGDNGTPMVTLRHR
jgi:hypothetical protein